MSKIFIFGIGGTGSRVLRAFTMLMASGVQLPNGFDKVIPIIVDPDSANGDMNRTADILTKYQEIRMKTGGTSGLFSSEIQTLKQFLNGNIPNLKNNFEFHVEGTNGEKFEDFIEYNDLSVENKAFIDLFFSSDNLKADMDVGFKGNPNIGSVVLNQLASSLEYKEFAGAYNPGDLIFVISSIFGGTGAAGFPLLLKNFRTNNPDVAGSDKTKEAKIGALTFLPYFKISSNQENSAIDSSSFMGKTKAALSYYEHAIMKTNTLNAFYYLGENADNTYKYNEGKEAQKNKAHFLELAGSLAILDFMKMSSNLETKDGIATTTVSKEFGVENDVRKLSFIDLGRDARNELQTPLSKLMLLSKFISKTKDKAINSRDRWCNGDGISKDFFEKSEFYNNEFEPFINFFNEWIKEMENNDIHFCPFHHNQDFGNLLNFINGKSVENGFLSKKASSDKLISVMNKYSSENSKDSDEVKFLKIMDQSLTETVGKILK